VRNKHITDVVIQESSNGVEIIATNTDGKKVHVNGSLLDRGLTGDLIANNVHFDIKRAKSSPC